MAERLKTVAIVSANPALSSILSSALAANRLLRVRTFESCIALAFYARIAPVDLVVADIDDGFDIEMVEASDASAAPMIGLSRADRPVEGVGEVMVKPVSPARLLKRTLATLDRRSALSSIRERSNVVDLFRRRPEPLPQT